MITTEFYRHPTAPLKLACFGTH